MEGEKEKRMKRGAILVQLELKYYQLNRTLHPELVPYDSPLVVLHTISIVSFHLWCMFGGT